MNKNRDAVMKWVAPLLVGVVVLVVWHALVKAFDIPKYLVPSPAMVVARSSAAPGTAGRWKC
mgnify:CR=1 FL=1